MRTASQNARRELRGCACLANGERVSYLRAAGTRPRGPLAPKGRKARAVPVGDFLTDAYVDRAMTLLPRLAARVSRKPCAHAVPAPPLAGDFRPERTSRDFIPGGMATPAFRSHPARRTKRRKELP